MCLDAVDVDSGMFLLSLNLHYDPLVAWSPSRAELPESPATPTSQPTPQPTTNAFTTSSSNSNSLRMFLLTESIPVVVAISHELVAKFVQDSKREHKKRKLNDNESAAGLPVKKVRSATRAKHLLYPKIKKYFTCRHCVDPSTFGTYEAVENHYTTHHPLVSVPPFYEAIILGDSTMYDVL